MVAPPVVRLRDLVVLVSCALCVWGAACVRAASVARAQALEALVRRAEPHDEALFGRIRGQASDLPVSLREVIEGPLEPTLHEQLATARALAEPLGARVVIWAARSAPRLTIVVADLSLGRVLVRELGRDARERDRSAQEEAAALVVRSALKATIAGESLGAEERELVQEPPPAARPPPPPPPPPPPLPPAVPEPPKVAKRERTPSWGGLLGLGALGSADGATSSGSYGLSGRTALRYGRVELGLRGELGLRAKVSAPFARVELAQHRAGAYAGYSLLQGEQLRLTLAATCGMHVFATRARSGDDARFMAETGRSVVPSVGAGWLLTYLPHWARGHVGVAASAFFEGFPERLKVGYASSSGFVPVATLWPVQPVLVIELVFQR